LIDGLTKIAPHFKLVSGGVTGMKTTQVKKHHARKRVSECGGAAAFTAPALSQSPAAPAQPTTVAGFSTFREIIVACERGEPLPPQIEVLGNYLASQVIEITNILKAAFEEAPSKEVARLFTQFPNPALMEIPIEDTPKRIREIVKWFATHQRKLPKQFRRFVAKQLTCRGAGKPPKTNLRKLVAVETPKVKRIRAPDSQKKANNEDAEGDADSHSLSGIMQQRRKKKVGAIMVAKPTLKGLGVRRSFKGGEGR
jgi:hypothetical protein